MTVMYKILFAMVIFCFFTSPKLSRWSMAARTVSIGKDDTEFKSGLASNVLIEDDQLADGIYIK